MASCVYEDVNNPGQFYCVPYPDGTNLDLICQSNAIKLPDQDCCCNKNGITAAVTSCVYIASQNHWRMYCGAQPTPNVGAFSSGEECAKRIVECKYNTCCDGAACSFQLGEMPCPFGGTSIGESIPCAPNPCGIGCCLCDRCCDGLSAAQCIAKGGQTMAGSCASSGVRSTCSAANVKPACKSTRMGLAIRPSQHYPNEAGQNPAAPGRLEIVSRNPQRAKDRAVATDECRYVYAWGQKAVGNDGAIEGRMCNQFNRNCVSSKVTQKARLVKSQSFPGAVEFYGQYRAACPEQADFVSNCTTRVPCPA